MADDKLQIPDADRIHNISPLPDNFDPNDDTLLNADWVMRIFDKIVNGEYATKPFTTYATVGDLPSADVLAGQTAYVEAEPSHFYLYNGMSWCQMPNITEASGGTINDSTITLTLDGITQGSFTLNQANAQVIDVAGVALPTNEIVSGEYVSLNCKANTNYFLGTVSGLTISSIAVDSRLETNIYFTTNSSAFAFANISGMSQWIGNTPMFSTGKRYVINICNGIGAFAEIVME